MWSTEGPLGRRRLVNNVWSFGGTRAGGTKYNNSCSSLRQLQFRRRLVCRHRADHHGELAGDRRQSLDPAGRRAGRPGDQVGDKLPVNLLLGAYYNALRPEFGSTWQFRSQVTFIF